MAKSHAPVAADDPGTDARSTPNTPSTAPATHTEPMPPVSQLQDPQKDQLLPQQQEAIAKQAVTRHDVQLTETEKGAIRATVNSWLEDVSHHHLEAGSRHRLTLIVTPEQRYVSDRALGEVVDPNKDGVRRIDSTMTGRPGLR